jgi:cellobiose-specific phosphotransferase system component IIB
MSDKKKVVILSRSSMQTERFMKHVRDHQAKEELNYEVELALYPKHMELILAYKPDFVLLSTEVIAWKPEIEKELAVLGIPNALVKGSHYGTAQVLRIFNDSVKL